MIGHDSKILSSGAVVLFLVVLTAVIFGSNAEEIAETANGIADDIFQGQTTKIEEGSGSGQLAEGGEDTVTIDADNRAIKNITAVLTWTDEPDQRRVRLYQNQPDRFSMSIIDPEGNVTDSSSGSNTRGGEGNIELQVSLSNEQIQSFMGSDGWTITISLESVGDYEARVGVGLWPVTPTDDGNQYSLSYDIEYYEISEEE